MNQLMSILKSLFVSLALVIGGMGTAAAAGSTGSTDADATADQGPVAMDQRSSEDDAFIGYDEGDDDEDDDDDDW